MPPLPGNSKNPPKLRQTTLPWAPRPRASLLTASTSNSKSSNSRQADNGRHTCPEVSPFFAGTSASNGSATEPLEDSQAGSTQDTVMTDAPPTAPSSLEDREGGHFLFQVPPWSRPVRALIKPSAAARHDPARSLIAQETLSRIPSIVDATSGASVKSELYVEPLRGNPAKSRSEWRLDPGFSPGLPRTRVRVVNEDTFSCALGLLSQGPASSGAEDRVCVLNMASQYLQGGGWLEGSIAQEEDLCYRSTLARTLKPSWYPLPHCSVAFSPGVAVFRGLGPGYKDLPEPVVVAVASAAALRLNKAKDTYEKEWHREAMEGKIRLLLRVLGRRKQRRVVLGALGCGAFNNPNREVAQLFKKVLLEQEFTGWWKDVVFAVLVPKKTDATASSNYHVFREILDGLEV